MLAVQRRHGYAYFMKDILWIDDDKTLATFCTEAAKHAMLAVDTEFHRERTYYAQLALVQLGSHGVLACVDPLAKLNLSPLFDLLTDENVLKLVHAGRQDVEIFFQLMNKTVTPIFDTQVAAALCGYGEQVAYGVLVERLCKVRLEKSHGRTDWMRRPLDKAVVEYAVDDVHYLPEMVERLTETLQSKGRRDWLDEEQTLLTDEKKLVVDVDQVWKKLKGAGKLRGVSCAIAQHVAAWREKRAMHKDLPKRRILSDEVVVDLARQKPKGMAELDRMRGLEDGLKRRYGKELLKLVSEAEAFDEANWPAPKEGKPRLVDDAQVAALQAVLEIQAREHGISPQILASKNDLQKLCSGERDVSVVQGWRHELAGEVVLGFLAGERSLTCSGKKLVLK
ncbi:MAG: ribonuclease D [Deltaproteobacteria bacterium]|nr:ribonuclease D [Deltaproteobacteria bacterium]